MKKTKSRGNQEVPLVRKNVSLVVILCCPQGLRNMRFTAYLTQTWICFIGLQTCRFWPSISSIVRFLVFLHVFVWNYYTLGVSRLIFNELRDSSKYLMRGKKENCQACFVFKGIVGCCKDAMKPFQTSLRFLPQLMVRHLNRGL